MVGLGRLLAASIAVAVAIVAVAVGVRDGERCVDYSGRGLRRSRVRGPLSWRREAQLALAEAVAGRAPCGLLLLGTEAAILVRKWMNAAAVGSLFVPTSRRQCDLSRVAKLQRVAVAAGRLFVGNKRVEAEEAAEGSEVDTAVGGPSAVGQMDVLMVWAAQPPQQQHFQHFALRPTAAVEHCAKRKKKQFMSQIVT